MKSFCLPLPFTKKQERKNKKKRKKWNKQFKEEHPDQNKINYVTGNSTCNKGHGYAPVPKKGLLQRMKLHCDEFTSINEDFTSQTCPRCHLRLQNAIRDNHEIHGVRVCPNCTRRTGSKTVQNLFLSRDPTSADDINQVFIYGQINNGRRHPKFTRQYHQSLKILGAVALAVPYTEPYSSCSTDTPVSGIRLNPAK